MTFRGPRVVTFAMSMLPSVLEDVTADTVVSTSSERYAQLKDEATTLLNGKNRPFIVEFGKKMEDIVRNCIPDPTGFRSVASLREKSLQRFMSVRIDALPSIWDQLFEKAKMTLDDPLLSQCVNRRLFEKCLADVLKQSEFASASAFSTSQRDISTLTSDEENALRYASGFVPFKLLKKYSRQSTERAVSFTQVLRSMSNDEDELTVDHDHDYTFVNYTCAWLSLIDRGGLFRVNDASYQFFLAIEMVVRVVLPRQLAVKQKSDVSALQSVLRSADVQKYWTAISSDLDDESDRSMLLEEIVSLWITMRGFSLTSSWLEKYKEAKQEATKKKRAREKRCSRLISSELRSQREGTFSELYYVVVLVVENPQFH